MYTIIKCIKAYILQSAYLGTDQRGELSSLELFIFVHCLSDC